MVESMNGDHEWWRRPGTVASGVGETAATNGGGDHGHEETTATATNGADGEQAKWPRRRFGAEEVADRGRYGSR
jgi:hypothetical protein